MNNSKVKVSIIMPAYNAEKFIAESIKSILNQTFVNFELIILNDCSQDNTLDIIENLAKDDSRIRIINNEKNLNIAANRNKGIQISRGEYIVWQDADDISLPNRIYELVEFMDKNPQVGICGSYMQSFKNDELLEIRKYPTDDFELRKIIFQFSPVAQPSAIVRKECFKKIGLFDPALPPAEDLDISFRIGQFYKFANIPHVLLKYREHENSATYTKIKRIILNTLAIRMKYSKGFGYKMRVYDYLINFFTWLIQFLPTSLIILAFKKYKNFIMFFNK